MTLRFSTTASVRSGEYLEIRQMAEATGGELVTGVPDDGLLVYMVNLNIRSGVDDLKKLASRKGRTAFVIGVCRGWDEVETWRPHFEVLKGISPVFFVHHEEQIDYLLEYGIQAHYVLNNEVRTTNAPPFQPNTILYTGFYWEEKDLGRFLLCARELPEWNLVIQVGMNLRFDVPMPTNVSFEGRFLEEEDYRQFLARHEYIWIPRFQPRHIYAGRSGFSAVASGRPTLLPDVRPNQPIPKNVAIKYRPDSTPAEIAALIRSRPLPDPLAVQGFLDRVEPRAVWAQMREVMLEVWAGDPDLARSDASTAAGSAQGEGAR